MVDDLGNGQNHLRNAATGDYMHIENQQAWAQSTPKTADWMSAKWIFEDAGGGYIRIKNAWQASNYLNVENQAGYVEQGPISAGWWSAQWVLVPAP
jgi:hypothetical protein